MHTYIVSLAEAFASFSDDYKAQGMSQYLKNQFEFFGISAGDRRQIQRVHVKNHGWPKSTELNQILLELWEMPEREFQYFALDIYIKFHKKLKVEDVELIEKLIISKAWWDTVDMLATWICGAYFQKYPKQITPITGKWMDSKNIWLQRSCILFQLKYKKKTDFDLLAGFILKLDDSTDFFIQKSIGWSLREYSKIYPNVVSEFVNNNDLSNLSKREALKIIQKKY